MKCLGAGIGRVGFAEIEVHRAESGAPELSLHGRAAVVADELGVERWWLSLSHTSTLAQAVALATGRSGRGC